MTDPRVEAICARRCQMPLRGWEARDLASSGWPHIVYVRQGERKAHTYEEMLAVAHAEG